MCQTTSGCFPYHVDPKSKEAAHEAQANPPPHSRPGSPPRSSALASAWLLQTPQACAWLSAWARAVLSAWNVLPTVPDVHLALSLAPAPFRGLVVQISSSPGRLSYETPVRTYVITFGYFLLSVCSCQLEYQPSQKVLEEKQGDLPPPAQHEPHVG